MKIFMSRLHLLIFFFIIHHSLYSQYTDIINSNRPGNSFGAFSVGKNILQLESGIFHANEKHELLNYNSVGNGLDFSLRFGFLNEKLEIILNGIYQSDEFSDLRYTPPNKYNRKNFKEFKIGGKYLIYDPRKNMDNKPNVYSYWSDKKFKLKNLIPAISVYLGLNIDSKNNPYTNPNLNGISPSVSLITQSNISNRSALIINLNLERFTSQQSDFEYVLSLTNAFSEKFIGFIEKHGIKSDFYSENKLSTGLAYLFLENLQVDLGTTVNFKNTPKIFYINLGFSYRYNLN